MTWDADPPVNIPLIVSMVTVHIPQKIVDGQHGVSRATTGSEPNKFINSWAWDKTGIKHPRNREKKRIFWVILDFWDTIFDVSRKGALMQKSWIFLLALLLAPLVNGQATQTNCQVIGQQINCTTRPSVISAPMPDFNVKNPQIAPASTESPALVRALAEKREQEFAAAEASRRIAVEKFEAELSAPDVWTALDSGVQYHVRMTKDRIYFQTIPNPGLPAGAYASVECQPADSAWTCISHSTWPFPKKKGPGWNTNAHWEWKWCQHESNTAKLNSISLDRIEIEHDSIPTPRDFDINKCVATKTVRVTSTLIPRKANTP